MDLTFDLIARNLRLPSEVVNVASELVERRDWKEEKIQGVWGAALLTAWDLLRSKNVWRFSAKLRTVDVARASGVSRGTISSRQKDFKELLTLEELMWISEPEERLIIRTAQAQAPVDTDVLIYVRRVLEAHRKAISIEELGGSL